MFWLFFGLLPSVSSLLLIYLPSTYLFSAQLWSSLEISSLWPRFHLCFMIKPFDPHHWNSFTTNRKKFSRLSYFSRVVQERLSSESEHWHFPHANLKGLWTAILGSLLPCKRKSGCDQHPGRNLLPPRRSDSRQLSGQFPDPGLWCRLHRSLDTSGEVSTRSQVEHPELNCHHAIWKTCRYWLWHMV